MSQEPGVANRNGDEAKDHPNTPPPAHPRRYAGGLSTPPADGRDRPPPGITTVQRSYLSNFILDISASIAESSSMKRERYLSKIKARFAVAPVVALLGPRQCGKTTLARMYADRLTDTSVTRFDLEDPTDLAALAEPKLALQGLGGLVIIDEIQRAPELFPLLRVLVDRPGNPARFLILGSASRDLIRQSSETLAGRIGHLELTPLQLGETGAENSSSATRDCCTPCSASPTATPCCTIPSLVPPGRGLPWKRRFAPSLSAQKRSGSGGPTRAPNSTCW